MATEKQLKTDGVEEEQLYPEAYEKEIVEPFNPKDVDIVSQPMVISNIIDQLKYNDILLEPDFQRHPDLWNPKQQSRLIESLIIRIPLPTFYFDSTKDDKLIVVDGLQRLYAIKRFMVLDKEDSDRLRLTDLEYLSEYEGKIFEELPANIRRRIKAQTLTAYVIRPGTPDKVRTSIFTRINTGGLTLEPAEIKNSVYRGHALQFLYNCRLLLLRVGKPGLFPAGDLKEGRLCDIYISLLDQRRTQPVEHGQNEGADLISVHVRVRTDDHFIPAQVIQVEGIQILHVLILHLHAAAQNLYQVRDNLALENPRVIGLEAVENFSPHGHDPLKFRVPAQLHAAQGAVALHDVDFPAAHVLCPAVYKFLHPV